MALPGSDQTLAQELKRLRTETWPDLRVTQQQLSVAMGISVPLVSSWENAKALPPVERLADYATFFATRRPAVNDDGSYRLAKLRELSTAEDADRSEILDRLNTLRSATLGSNGPTSTLGTGSWYFPDGGTVTIVCAELPSEMQSISYANPSSPDYVELYRYADLDSLFELHGHIRAVNPECQVYFRTASALSPDDYATHLVLLGGVDWNEVTRDLTSRANLPARQTARDTDSIGGFEVVEKGKPRLLSPVVGPGEQLLEDVAQYYRGPNPYKTQLTVTICNGMFGRGTLGAVRALTDANFRSQNESYIARRFATSRSYMIVMSVLIVNGKTVTPDWTNPVSRLYEWDEGAGER